jgi:hypothetical protein
VGGNTSGNATSADMMLLYQLRLCVSHHASGSAISNSSKVVTLASLSVSQTACRSSVSIVCMEECAWCCQANSDQGSAYP